MKTESADRSSLTDLDDRTVRMLHATGDLDANTATYWLLLLSAQERARWSPAPEGRPGHHPA